MSTVRKKKDFKIRHEIVVEFERLAPPGKQTAIIESLLTQWISDERRRERALDVRRAYDREKDRAANE